MLGLPRRPCSRAFVPLLAATVLALAWTSLASAQASDPYAPPSAANVPTERTTKRLLVFIPRVGAQLGMWAGKLQTTVEANGIRLREEDDASKGASFVGGAELAFRLGSHFRLGAGLLAMPAVRVHLDGDDTSSHYRLSLGTILRVPAVIEWLFPVTHDFAIVVGAIPALAFLVRGDQAKHLADALCGKRCADDPAIGAGVEAELGTLLDLGRMGLRTDLRFGFDMLSLASDDRHDAHVDITLIGARMMLLAGLEI